MLYSTAVEKACRGLFSASGPAGNFDNHVQHRRLGRSPQIRDMNFRDTTAPFTVSADHQASLSCANSPADSAFYGVSVRRLVALRPASFRHRLAALPLPFASRCCSGKRAGGHRQGTCTPEFIPMLGVHERWSGRQGRRHKFHVVVISTSRLRSNFSRSLAAAHFGVKHHAFQRSFILPPTLSRRQTHSYFSFASHLPS